LPLTPMGDDNKRKLLSVLQENNLVS
jgi:hypothetical protein